MEHICKNCRHFRQHYVKWGCGYREVNCGHCPCPRLKSKKGTAKACAHFTMKEVTYSSNT